MNIKYTQADADTIRVMLSLHIPKNVIAKHFKTSSSYIKTILKRFPAEAIDE